MCVPYVLYYEEWCNRHCDLTNFPNVYVDADLGAEKLEENVDKNDLQWVVKKREL